MITVSKDSRYHIGVKEGEHRRVVSPGHFVGTTWTPTDVSGEPDELQALAAEMWTEDVVDEWRALCESLLPAEGYPLANAQADLVALLGGATASILAAYPECERLSWDAKEAEAIAAAEAGTPAPADYPLLRDEIAATLGIDSTDVTAAQISDKAAAVLVKAAAWRALVSRIAGLRQRYSAALEAAASADERAAIIAEAREELAAG